jgi:hypothetical protein
MLMITRAIRSRASAREIRRLPQSDRAAAEGGALSANLRETQVARRGRRLDELNGLRKFVRRRSKLV